MDQNIVKKSVPVYAVQKLLEESDHNNFQRYLDILKEEAKEKTVILLFGDHQRLYLSDMRGSLDINMVWRLRGSGSAMR